MNETLLKFSLGRLRIGLKLVLIPAIFIFSMILMMSFVISAQQERRNDADIIDLLGRQRTLNQWYGKALLVAGHKQNQDYAYWRDTFLQTAQALEQGGQAVKTIHQPEMLNLPAAPTEALRAKIRQQQGLIKSIMALEVSFLTLSPQDPQYHIISQKMDQMSAGLHQMINEAVRMYRDYSVEKIDEMNRNVLILGLLISFLGLVLNWVISRAITQPLQDLTQRAHRVSRGQLGGEPLAIRSLDEVGQLTESFNTMTQSLRELAQQNNVSIKDLSASTAEILASTQQQNASTLEQVSALQETTATMEEVRQSGQQISTRAHEVTAESERSVNLTEDGLQSIQQTVGTMDNIRLQVNQVAENIVSLSEKNRAVGNIIAMVTDIAEQSNLLALNAAIEAAAAGEQGRSFAVVASEMKHLATQAKDATTQVRSILEEIQQGITRAVLLTEEAVKKVETGREQTDVADQTIRKMAQNTQQNIQAFQQIAAATNQQQLGFEQVFQALKDIRQGTEQTAVSTQQLNRACDSLNAMSQNLQSGVSRYQL